MWKHRSSTPLRLLPKRADLGLERADLRPDRVDFRPDRVDFRTDRADFRPERAGGDRHRNEQKNEQNGIGWGADIKCGRLI